VQVIGKSHDPSDMIDESQPALAKGLILQKEIHYFRQARGNIDVVRGEVLPAYVERVRESTSTSSSGVVEYRIDVCLRSFGGQAKAQELSDLILQRLYDSRNNNGRLEIGDKSTPQEILHEFPGISKKTFKAAVSKLYKLGLVQPEPYSISLLQQKEK
jgi:predicted RNA-binding protein (virulence factor B family)